MKWRRDRTPSASTGSAREVDAEPEAEAEVEAEAAADTNFAALFAVGVVVCWHHPLYTQNSGFQPNFLVRFITCDFLFIDIFIDSRFIMLLHAVHVCDCVLLVCIRAKYNSKSTCSDEKRTSERQR